MSFLTDETGFDTGNPIELYRFVGSLDTYCYTSNNMPVVFGADTYRPEPIQRTEIILGDVTERNELKVKLTTNNKLIKDYGFDIPPPILDLEIYRLHGNGEVQRIFSGFVSSIVAEGNKATVIIPSIFTAYMDTEFPNVYFQGPCNRPLYSTTCGVNREAFKIVGTVSSIIARNIITVAGASSRPDNWLRAGELLTGDERRLIVKHEGNTLTLNYPFRALKVGDAVTMFAGCLHHSEDCDLKFNNLVNFFGFEHTPSLNPFLEGLK